MVRQSIPGDGTRMLAENRRQIKMGYRKRDREKENNEPARKVHKKEMASRFLRDKEPGCRKREMSN